MKKRTKVETILNSTSSPLQRLPDKTFTRWAPTNYDRL